MVEMELPSTPKPPQISEMFQKFALAFKTKTYELLTGEEEEEEENNPSSSIFTLLDSAEEFIPDQKVIIIKPDSARVQDPGPNIDTHLARSLIASLFAAVSSFGASYLQLQAAHVPFNADSIEAADKALVAILLKLAEMKRTFLDLMKNVSLDVDFGGGCSFLEFQVQENQNKLRALETMVNQLQSDIDCKDDQVLILRKKLDKVEGVNKEILKRLGFFRYDKDIEIKFTFRVFDCMLSDCVKALRCFTKLLIDLMRKADWDLEKAANSVYSDVVYAKGEHNKYVFLSYISLAMFRGFNLDDFGVDVEEVDCNGNGSVLSKDVCRKALIEHASCNPMEVLGKNPTCNFSRFCEKKYEQLIHPSMESSMFSNVDKREAVLSSWKSLRVFYESFVRMASSIWLLHKLGYCFNPVVEIFQVERGTDFSMVYMEDVTRKGGSSTMSRPKVAFTVVPGFKVGRTVIQSQVYPM